MLLYIQVIGFFGMNKNTRSPSVMRATEVTLASIRANKKLNLIHAKCIFEKGKRLEDLNCNTKQILLQNHEII